MKNLKMAIIILISLILILVVTLLTLHLIGNNNSNNNLIDYSSKKSEIQNYIVFESANYESIDNIVFYSKDVKMDDTLKNNLTLIANEFKTKYPNRTILYLRDLGSAQLFNAKELYRCMQIANGQKLDDTDMNVLIKEDGSVDIQFLIGCSWKNSGNTENIKITQAQAEQILIDYLAKNPSDYNELRNGFFKTNSEKCTVELYKYNSKTSWKMQFLTGNSYVIIDANTGEILDTYFFCGVYVD